MAVSWARFICTDYLVYFVRSCQAGGGQTDSQKAKTISISRICAVDWLGGLNANGCSGSGSGFDCTAAWFSGVPVPSGTPYLWAWDVEMTTGTLFTGALESSIKVRYVDADNNKVGALVSEGITLQTNPNLIPEPATAALLGGGLLALAFARRRSR
jgi:hypothetical protein